MLSGITTSKLHITKCFSKGTIRVPSSFLRVMTSTSWISILIRIPGFNPMRLTNHFLFAAHLCTMAGIQSSGSPTITSSMSLTDPLIEVPSYCVSTLTSENFFLLVEGLLRYGGSTKKRICGQTVSDKKGSLLVNQSLQYCFRTSCLSHKNSSCYAGKTANMPWNKIANI